MQFSIISVDFNHFQISTKLNLIPIDFPHIKFSETFKSDFNELIYNFGGFKSLGFGLSSVSTFKLNSILSFIYVKLKPLFTKFLLFLLRILIKDSVQVI
jgi:hypothetical protein